jgi:hypothetical protein
MANVKKGQLTAAPEWWKAPALDQADVLEVRAAGGKEGGGTAAGKRRVRYGDKVA